MKITHRLTVKETKVIDAFLHRLKRQYGSSLEKVILYGSRARGEATNESDYDLLVVLSEVKDFWRTVDEMGNMTHEFLLKKRVWISAIPVDEAEINRRRASPFFMNVKREGRVVYGR
jgi:predicted nucleotidyltransferase